MVEPALLAIQTHLRQFHLRMLAPYLYNYFTSIANGQLDQTLDFTIRSIRQREGKEAKIYICFECKKNVPLFQDHE